MASISAGRAPRLEMANPHQCGDDACDSYAYQHGLRGGSRLLRLICRNCRAVFDGLDQTIDLRIEPVLHLVVDGDQFPLCHRP